MLITYKKFNTMESIEKGISSSMAQDVNKIFLEIYPCINNMFWNLTEFELILYS